MLARLLVFAIPVVQYQTHSATLTKPEWIVLRLSRFQPHSMPTAPDVRSYEQRGPFTTVLPLDIKRYRRRLHVLNGATCGFERVLAELDAIRNGALIRIGDLHVYLVMRFELCAES